MDDQTHNGYPQQRNDGNNGVKPPFEYGDPSFQNRPFQDGNPDRYSSPGYSGMRSNQNDNRRPSFGESIGLFFRRYTDFSGRSRRSEFWNIALFYILIWFLAQLFGPALMTLASLVMLVPFIALQCRRLHDIGKSGHWIWLYVLSVVAFNVLTCYSVIYVLTYFPELNDMMEAQGFNPQDLYFLYPLLNIPNNYIIFMSVFVVVVNILFLVFNCTDSQRGTNQYGPSPKYPDSLQAYENNNI